MTLKNFSRKAAGLAFLGALLAVPATGALAQGTPQERSDCTGDAFQFCASAIPNVPQIQACLKANLNQLVAGLPVGVRAVRALPPETRALQLIRRS